MRSSIRSFTSLATMTSTYGRWPVQHSTADYLIRSPDIKIPEPPDFKFKPPWHKTNIFLEEQHGRLITFQAPTFSTQSLADTRKIRRPKVRTRERKHGSGFEIWVAYPNFGLLSPDGKKCILIHHGHFAEPIYRLMSTLNNFLNEVDDDMPTDMDDLQRENFAWIEFFWSMLGRSGRVGETVESLWEQLSDENSTKILARRLARTIVKRSGLPVVDGPLNIFADWVVEEMEKWNLFQDFRPERTLGDLSMSQELRQEIISYMKYPLWNQMRMEMKDLGKTHNLMPEEMSLIIGHTHKPMQETIDLSYPVKSASIYNTGGWVIDKANPEPAYGGAIAFIDGNMNVALLGMFREACEENNRSSSTIAIDPEKKCRQKVMLLEEGLPNNDLTNRLKLLIKSSESPWREFSSVAADEMTIREKNIAEASGKIVKR